METTEHNVGILIAEFNKQIADVMLASALDEANTLGVTISNVIRVSGCFDMPCLVQEMLEDPRNSALVVLGFIERGETLHGEVMGHTVESALVELSLKHRKPVGFGIIGPGALLDQAEARKDSYARAAVRAAARTLDELRQYRATREP